MLAPAYQENSIAARGVFRQSISLSDLEGGDVILQRYPFDGDKDVLFQWLIETGMRLLSAKDVSDVPLSARSRLVDFLISIFDEGGFCSVAIVGRLDPDLSDEKFVLQTSSGAVRTQLLSDFRCDDAMAYRYCRGAVALGDAHLPAGPVLERINQLEALAEEDLLQEHTNLPQLLLAIWRRCGSFNLADIKDVIKEAFAKQHEASIDLFFEKAGAALEHLLIQVADIALKAVKKEQSVLCTELAATAFYQVGEADNYPLMPSGQEPCISKPYSERAFASLEFRLVSGKLRQLAIALNAYDAGKTVKDCTGSLSKLLAALAPTANMTSPSDFAGSPNMFPLGHIDD